MKCGTLSTLGKVVNGEKEWVVKRFPIQDVTVLFSTNCSLWYKARMVKAQMVRLVSLVHG